MQPIFFIKKLLIYLLGAIDSMYSPSLNNERSYGAVSYLDGQEHCS